MFGDTFNAGPPGASGVWTPTLTLVGNVTSAQAFPSGWARVGRIVFLFLTLNVTFTAAGGLSTVGFSTPVPSGLSGNNDAAGNAVSFPIGVATTEGVVVPAGLSTLWFRCISPNAGVLNTFYIMAGYIID